MRYIYISVSRIDDVDKIIVNISVSRIDEVDEIYLIFLYLEKIK